MIVERSLVRVSPRGQRAATCALGVVIDGLVAWHFGWSPSLPAFLALGVVAAVVTVSDLAGWRIANAVVLPAYPSIAVLLTFACAPDGPWWPLARAGIAATLTITSYLLLALTAPGQLALGDVRLGGLLAGSLAFLGWSTVATGTLVGWLLAVPVMMFRQRGNSGHRVLPLAPFLVVGAFTLIVTSR